MAAQTPLALLGAVALVVVAAAAGATAGGLSRPAPAPSGPTAGQTALIPVEPAAEEPHDLPDAVAGAAETTPPPLVTGNPAATPSLTPNYGSGPTVAGSAIRVGYSRPVPPSPVTTSPTSTSATAASSTTTPQATPSRATVTVSLPDTTVTLPR